MKPLTIHPARRTIHDIGYFGVMALMLVFTAAMTIASFIETCEISQQNPLYEIIAYSGDRYRLSTTVLILGVTAVFLLSRIRYSPLALKICAGVVLFTVTALSFVWSMAVQPIPGADSKFVYDAAVEVAAGRYSVLKEGVSYDYFRRYPFQLGLLSYFTLLVRIFGDSGAVFGAAGCINAVCFNLAYIAVLKITHRVFSDNRVTFLNVIAILLFAPAIFFCTFLYGNVLGLALTIWGVYFAVRYLQTGKWKFLLPMALLLALACIVKPNYLIFVIAVGIVLLLDAVLHKRWAGLLSVAAAAIVLVSLNFCIKTCYESKADTEFGVGTPQSAWLVMGLSESPRAFGWYNRYTQTILIDHDYNVEEAKVQIAEDLCARLSVFRSNRKEMLYQLWMKLKSTWNEPTFSSIWVSEVWGHQSEIPSYAERLYSTDGYYTFEEYCNQYLQLLYLFVTWGFIALMFDKKRSSEKILLPLIVLGGILYHLLFETKSQYALVYMPLLMPVAAYGIVRVFDGFVVQCAKLSKKLLKR